MLYILSDTYVKKNVCVYIVYNSLFVVSMGAAGRLFQTINVYLFSLFQSFLCCQNKTKNKNEKDHLITVHRIGFECSSI